MTKSELRQQLAKAMERHGKPTRRAPLYEPPTPKTLRSQPAARERFERQFAGVMERSVFSDSLPAPKPPQSNGNRPVIVRGPKSRKVAPKQSRAQGMPFAAI